MRYRINVVETFEALGEAMGFLQLIIAMLALYLFLKFVALSLLLAWRLLGPSPRRDAEPRIGPDDVEPLPVLDLKDFGGFRQMGRDRFGRMIFEVDDRQGRFSYYYLDREASEAMRLGRNRRQSPPDEREEAPSAPEYQEPRPALGWKGFTADSSPWEVLGVARDASVAQIKAAYRKLITKYHPDRFSNLTKAEIAELERDSKLINAAYSKLVKS